MKLNINKDSLVIIPENPQDEAFIEDSLQLKDNGDKLIVEKVYDVMTGFKSDKYSLKIERLKLDKI